MKQKPTLKTISALSGLAVATVSRALGDAPDISEKTKERVRKIASDVGYVPNRAGVRLRTGRTNVVSLILPIEFNMANHTARLQSAIAHEFRGTPFHLNITPTFDDQNPLDPVRHIVENNLADGIIINSTRPRDERVSYLMERKFPFVTHGRTDFCAQHSYFDFDNQAFVELAVRHLASRGRKNIHVLVPPKGMNYTENMVQGVEMVSENLEAHVQIIDGINGDMASSQIHDLMVDYLTHYQGIDGLVVTSPLACMAVVAAAESKGLQLDRDIDVFSREAIPFLKFFRPQIQLVRENIDWVGENAARAIINQIRTPDAKPMQGLETPDETYIH